VVTKGDRRRERILACVAELLETQSFEEISIAEITRRAEVTRPGFYFYFPTKGAAVASLMEGLVSEFMDAAAVWYEHRADDQETALRQGMGATIELWRKHAVVMHGMVQAASSEREAGEIWQRWVAAFTARAVPTIAADLGPRAAAGPSHSPHSWSTRPSPRCNATCAQWWRPGNRFQTYSTRLYESGTARCDQTEQTSPGRRPRTHRAGYAERRKPSEGDLIGGGPAAGQFVSSGHHGQDIKVFHP